jgi:hypothetical protein
MSKAGWSGRVLNFLNYGSILFFAAGKTLF